MKKIWFSFILLVLSLAVIKPSVSNNELIATIFILFNSIIIVLILMLIKNNQIKITLVIGFLLRLFLVFWDIYARNIFIIPNAATDDVGFYLVADSISDNLLLLNDKVYGGYYSKLMGSLFYLTGPSKILGGYFNVLLGISVVLLIIKALNLLNISNNIKIPIVIISTFFPNSLFMSAMFRREMIMSFLVALSLCYFIKWYLYNKNRYIIIATVLIVLSSLFHSGMISLISGYIIAFIFYDFRKNKLIFSYKTILYFFIVIFFVMAVYLIAGDQIFSKFGDFEDVDVIIQASNKGKGGARYLENLIITNPFNLIVYTPVKMFYFLFSPVPWEWRGIEDVLTFLFDSLIYLWSTIVMIKNIVYKKNRDTLVSFLFVSFIATVIIFGIGVGNAGTAMRHRQKILPLIVVIISLIIEGKNENKKMVSNGN